MIAQATGVVQATGGTAVIIPFFQRRPGLLAAAIRSALAQESARPATVIVCDDASPSPAELDLDMLTPAEQDNVLLIRQANGGCGMARNAALDVMPGNIEWIAFLDSDDRWKPAHLVRAITALQEGFDFFFADVIRDPEPRTHFATACFEPRKHERISALPDLYRFVGDFLTQNLTMSPVSILSVVVRASTLGDLRFKSVIYEDLMCWFEVARRRARVAFDGTLQVYYGGGEMARPDNWKSQHELENRLSAHKVFMHVLRSFTLASQQRMILERRIADNRRKFSLSTLGLVHSGRMPSWPMVCGFLKLDPYAAGSLVGTTITESARRLPFRRRKPLH